MAKKSAYSKGYRKTVQKDKPFLTKKEIIALIVIVLVVALAIVLFNLLYDDGFVDGKDIVQGDIATYSSTQNRERYLKLGTVNDLEGYKLESTRTGDGPITYTYTPETADEAVEESVIVRGSCVNAQALTETIRAYTAGETVKFTDTTVIDVNGQQGYLYGVTYNYYDETYAASAEDAVEETAEATEETAETEAPAEEAAETEAAAEEAPAEEAAAVENVPNMYIQSVTCNIAYNDDHCIVLEVSRVSHTDGEFYLADDEIEEFMKPYLSAVTVREDGRTMAFADYAPVEVPAEEAAPAEEEAAPAGEDKAA